MARIGFFILPGHGHIPPSLALARVLRTRGHEVVYYTSDHFRAEIERQDMSCVTVSLVPGRGRSRLLGRYGRILDSFGRLIDTTIQTLPARVQRDGVELLVVDQSVVSGRTIAELARIPFVTFIPGLPFRRDRRGRLPPLFAPWPPASSALARLRNRAAFRLLDLATLPFVRRLNRSRRSAGLPPHRHLDDSFSDDVCLTQFPGALEPEGIENDRPFHLVGPLIDSLAVEERERTLVNDFPWDEIDAERPLLYVSFGTVAPTTQEMYETALEGSAGLGFVRVLSMGGRPVPESLARRADHETVIVSFAPQLPLLRRASLVVTHAGLNTVLESLLAALPILAVPICDDQMGTAARLAWAGVGLSLPARKLTAERMQQALRRLRDEPAFGERARALSAQIPRGGGVQRAADLVEGLLPGPATAVPSRADR